MTTLSLVVLGRQVKAHGFDAVLEASLRNRWDFPEHVLPAVDFEIVLQRLDAPAVFQFAGPVSTLELSSGPLALHGNDPVFWFGNGRLGGRLELVSRGLRLEFWGTGPLCTEMVHLAIAEGLRLSGLLSLHTSMPARGAALALLGPSGRGKTTTLLRALAAGFAAVCEDLAWCNPEDLRVFGFDRGLRLLPDSAQLFEQLFGLQATIWQGDKWFVPFEAFTKRTSAQLKALVVLERQAALPTAWRSISRREAALALWEASGMPLSKLARQQAAATVTQMVRQLEPWCLRLGQGAIDWDSGPLRVTETFAEVQRT